jgi:hypothetical protein
MPFKVEYRGVTVTCDSPQEAVAIARELAGEPSLMPGNHHEEAGEGRLTNSRFKEFVNFLDTRQRKFLSILVENPHGKTDSTLRQALNLAGNKELGGFGSGISKLAKKAGLSMEDILTVSKVRIGDEDAREYKINPVFLRIAESSGGLK